MLTKVRLRAEVHKSKMKEIQIKYFNTEIDKIEFIGGRQTSDWIDLRAAETVEMKAGDFRLIKLGVGMKLPEGFEAHVVPRSSTFKKYGIIQTNHMGIIDNSYCGDNDEWMFPAYALRDTVINENDRICQFRIMESMPQIRFTEVKELTAASRGGFGSTDTDTGELKEEFSSRQSVVSDDAGETILEIKELCKKYPSFQLDKASFDVKAGRIMGFIGRNGAGKTTTLKCLLGLLQPDSGSIRYFGKDFKENETQIKQHIGYASGGVDYFHKKKIKDIVSVTRTFFEEWDEAAYREYMERFDLDEEKTPGELSAGMKVKLNLVMALSHHAKLLLLDEPTSGLDPVSRDEILMIFKYLRDRGCAILFSTHVTSDLDKCADDITYIHDGKVMISTTKEKFISENASHGNNVEEIMIWFEREKYANKYDGKEI